MKEYDRKILANNLKRLRNEKQLSQAELSQLLHVSQQTVGSWETGRAIPGSDTLNELADYFNTSTDELLGRPIPTSSSKNELNYEDFGLPYKGVISEDLNDTFRLLAQQYAEKHNLPKKDQ